MPFEPAPRDPSLADPLPASPLPLLERWLAEATERSGLPNPDAMALATVDAHGVPRVRIVLCRGFDARQGRLVFYTNRESAKGRELAAHPVASAVFHWDVLSRQARVSGPVVAVSDAESDTYFARRHRVSQLAARASRQSEPIASREALLERIRAEAERFGGFEDGAPVPRPPHWGGYALLARRVELWVGAEGRAHDRALWTREDWTREDWTREVWKREVGEREVAGPELAEDDLARAPWSVQRLQP